MPKGQIPWNKGKTLSKAHIESLKKAHKGMTGRTHSEETKRKIGIKSSARICSDETKQLMSRNRKGRTPWNKGLKGVCNPNSGSFQKGEKHYRWKDGRWQGTNGYWMVYSAEHPFRNKQQCVLEHRLVAENHLGRFLDPLEVVHHINKNIENNSPENLFVFENVSEHQIFHNLCISHNFLKTWLVSNIMAVME